MPGNFNALKDEAVVGDMPMLPPGIIAQGESRLRQIMFAVLEFANPNRHLGRDALLGGIALGAVGAFAAHHHSKELRSF